LLPGDNGSAFLTVSVGLAKCISRVDSGPFGSSRRELINCVCVLDWLKCDRTSTPRLSRTQTEKRRPEGRFSVWGGLVHFGPLRGENF